MSTEIEPDENETCSDCLRAMGDHCEDCGNCDCSCDDCPGGCGNTQDDCACECDECGCSTNEFTPGCDCEYNDCPAGCGHGAIEYDDDDE